MKLDLTGLRIEVTDAIREFVDKKIQKLKDRKSTRLNSSHQ